MFCSKCGQKADNGMRFCSKCGNQFGVIAKPSLDFNALPIVIAVYKNISLIKTEPYILRIDEKKCGFYKVDPGLINEITRFAMRDKDKVHILCEYAKSLRLKPLEVFTAEFPHRVEFDTAHIISLSITTYYDSDFHRHMDYDRFKIVSSEGKYRGAIGFETDISAYKQTLQALFGNRYSTRESVHGFDD